MFFWVPIWCVSVNQFAFAASSPYLRIFVRGSSFVRGSCFLAVVGGFWNDVLRSCEVSVEMTGSSHCLSFTGV